MTFLHCSFCPKDGQPFIDINTKEGKLAKKMEDGSLKCLACQTKEFEDSIIKSNIDKDRIRKIIEKRITKLERKATIKGMINAIDNNEQKDFSHLFRNPGIRGRKTK